jgi:hypothetical protein
VNVAAQYEIAHCAADEPGANVALGAELLNSRNEW